MTDAEHAEKTRLNEARVFAAEQEGSGAVDAWPIKMVFEFTAACNLHCFMCGFEMTRDELRGAGRTKFTLPVETFRLVADKAFPHISLINPTVSGEPFVLPYFDEMVDRAAEYGCRFEFISNGMLARGDRLEKVIPHLDSLTISFDGATKKTFEYVRTGAKFEQVLENVENFAKIRRERGLRDKIGFHFNVTLLAENVHELPDIIQLAADNDIDLVTVCYMVVNAESTRKSSPLNCPEKTNRALATAKKLAAELGVEVRLPLPLPANAAEMIRVETYGDGDLAPTPIPELAPDLLAGADDPSADESNANDPSGSAPGAAATPATVAPAGTTDNGTDDDEPEGRTRLTDGRPKDWKGKYYCNMAWRQVFIGQAGEVTPCCAPGVPNLGNAFETDFMEIWNGDEYRKLREGLFTGDLTSYCAACPFLQEAGELPYDADAHVLSKED